jgi:flagellar basal-body rod protein FlgG
MLRSLWTAKTGLDAQQTSLDTISNNLANVSTTAFKRARPVFEDLLYQNIRSAGLTENSGGAGVGDESYVPAGLQAGNGSRILATQRINSAGSLLQSSNPLDMAINGNGYFVVETGNGTAYTRSGNFMRGPTGNIVTPAGSTLLDSSGAPVTIPGNATDIVIGTDGTVTFYTGVNTPAVTLPNPIAIVNFVNPTGLSSVGGGLYFQTTSSGPALSQPPGMSGAGKPGFGTISQYYTEQSNVNVAEELVSLIAAQRAYEITAKSVSASDQILQKLGQL